MLFRQAFLEGIRAGAITLAFRRWRRPTVRSGGTLLTSVGQLEIGSVSQISEAEISAEESLRAGYASLENLLAELRQRSIGDVYRIELRSVLPDPRIGLRESLPDEKASVRILTLLRRLDARAARGAWTAGVLEVLAQHPGVRAGDVLGLGLTISRVASDLSRLTIACRGRNRIIPSRILPASAQRFRPSS